MLHEWGYTLTPGENCIFDLLPVDIQYLLDSHKLLYGTADEQGGEGEQKLRSGDMAMYERIKQGEAGDMYGRN